MTAAPGVSTAEMATVRACASATASSGPAVRVMSAEAAAGVMVSPSDGAGDTAQLPPPQPVTAKVTAASALKVAPVMATVNSAVASASPSAAPSVKPSLSVRVMAMAAVSSSVMVTVSEAELVPAAAGAATVTVKASVFSSRLSSVRLKRMAAVYSPSRSGSASANAPRRPPLCAVRPAGAVTVQSSAPAPLVAAGARVKTTLVNATVCALLKVTAYATLPASSASAPAVVVRAIVSSTGSSSVMVTVSGSLTNSTWPTAVTVWEMWTVKVSPDSANWSSMVCTTRSKVWPAAVAVKLALLGV